MKLNQLLIIPILTCLIFTSTTMEAQEDDFLIETFKEHKDKVNTVAFSKTAKYLASGSEDKYLVIRNLEDQDNSREFTDNYFPIKDMEFYGDLQLFISAGRDVKLVDLFNNQLALYKGSATHIWSLDYAPERNRLVAGSYDKTLKIWDVQSEEILKTLEGHEKSALSIVFSGDEKYLVSGSRDQSIRVWNAVSGDLLRTFERHSGNIYDIKFHPNTRYFASASEDKTIRLWDIEQGKVIKTYTGHDGSVLDVEFSPDGFFMYSCGVDGTVYVWEVATGKKLYSYVAHVGSVNSVDVSNDGNYVATGGDDGKVMLWKSAKYIIVETFMSSELEAQKGQNDLFDSKHKGESKSDYIIRQNNAKSVEHEIVDRLYQSYIKSNNYKKIPLIK